MEKQLWRKALIISVAFLFLACWGSCSEAHADEERVLPPGTTIQLPRDGDFIELLDPMFLVTRPALDNANVAFEMNRRLTEDLMECSGVLQEREKKEASWKSALRWTGFGAAIVGSFTLGLLLR